jgi:hypothetical protein
MRTLTTMTLILSFTLCAQVVQAQDESAGKAVRNLPSKQFLTDALDKMVKVEETLKNSSKINRKQQRSAQEEIALARLQIMDFLRELDRYATGSSGAEAHCKCPEGGKVPGEKQEGEPEAGTKVAEGAAEKPALAPMSQANFGTLLMTLKEQAFTDDKLKVVGTASANNNFTAGQTVAVLEQITFPDSKLATLRFLAGKIVDTENLFIIYKSFVHTTDKEAAMKILEGKK